MVNCPLCDAVIDAEEDELDEGDEFTCDECGESLTVVGKDPVEIKGTKEGDVEEDEEDVEDDEDDDDDDDDEDEEDEEEDEWK